MTRDQLATLHSARRYLERHDLLTDASYRWTLWNVANVRSSKALSNRDFEAVMGVFEEIGYQEHPSGPTYWRDKAARHGQSAGERMTHKINALAGMQDKYPLAGLCLRFSDGRTDRPDQLNPTEAHHLVEMLKRVAQREPAAAVPVGGDGVAPF